MITHDSLEYTDRKIYFLLAPMCRRIRIGRSKDVGHRIYEHRNSSPEKLQYLGCVSEDQFKEKDLHRRFSEYRSHGEWFHVDTSLLQFIEKHADKTSVNVTYKHKKGSR